MLTRWMTTLTWSVKMAQDFCRKSNRARSLYRPWVNQPTNRSPLATRSKVRQRGAVGGERGTATVRIRHCMVWSRSPNITRHCSGGMCVFVKAGISRALDFRQELHNVCGSYIYKGRIKKNLHGYKLGLTKERNMCNTLRFGLTFSKHL